MGGLSAGDAPPGDVSQRQVDGFVVLVDGVLHHGDGGRLDGSAAHARRKGERRRIGEGVVDRGSGGAVQQIGHIHRHAALQGAAAGEGDGHVDAGDTGLGGIRSGSGEGDQHVVVVGDGDGVGGVGARAGRASGDRQRQVDRLVGLMVAVIDDGDGGVQRSRGGGARRESYRQR